MITPERTVFSDAYGTKRGRRSLKAQPESSGQTKMTVRHQQASERGSTGKARAIVLDRLRPDLPAPQRSCRGAEFRCSSETKQMLQRFHPAAQEALGRACTEASRLRSSCVRSEHVLLALIDDATVVEVLLHLGIAPTDLRDELERHLSYGTTLLDGPPQLAADTRELVRATLEELHGLGHGLASVPHLLLGALSASVGFAAELLERYGANVDALRIEVLEQMAAEDAGAA